MILIRSILQIRDLILFDQLSKFLALILLKDRIVLLEDFFVLILKKNPGVSLGFLSNLQEPYSFYLKIFLWIAVGFFVANFLLFKNYANWFYRNSFILIIAGGASNQLNRLWFNGSVIDMLEVSVCGYELFTCNLADIYITIGFVLYLFSSLFYRNSSKLNKLVEPIKSQKDNLLEDKEDIINKINISNNLNKNNHLQEQKQQHFYNSNKEQHIEQENDINPPGENANDEDK